MLFLGASARTCVRRARRLSLPRRVAALALGLAGTLVASAPAFAEGYDMFSTSSYSTGEKPQSKLWYHDGSYWTIVDGPDGVAFYEKKGTSWMRGTFADAVLGASGQADVKWNGSELFVLNYTSSPQLFKYSYDAALRVWVLFSGFPVSVPKPSGSETMVLEQDSTGRLWTAVEGGGNVNVYYSTSADHRSWNSSPVVLQTGVNTDDICSIVAFGGNKIGVFWSDQNRDEFGFRIHADGDATSTWSSNEVVFKGSGNADDHINLAFDSSGRVYAITKDDRDRMAVHRRSTSGSWTTKTDVLGAIGTRGIIMVAEGDSKVYVLYTRWGVSPDRIEYRVADINTLSFGGTTTFISSSSSMNNVSGMKQILPPGSLIAIAENGSRCYYNSFGNPPAGSGPTPPGPPQNLVASLAGGGTQASLSWSPPTTGSTPDGYDIYRSVNGASFAKINSSPVLVTTFADNALGTGEHCYQVRAVKGALQSSASNTACVDNTPALPPGAPTNLIAQLVDTGGGGPTGAILDLPCDEGSGQQAADQSGNGNHARLGTTTNVDTADPVWVAGVAGMGLLLDGSNDFAEILDSPSLDPAGSFTLEAWVRWNGGTGAIVSKGASNERTYRVLITSGGSIEFLWEIPGGSNREVIASSALTDAAWHHVACVYDASASQNRIYLDGVLRASGSASGTPVTNTKTLLVGAYLGTSSKKGFLNGALDALHVIPGALYTSDFTPSALSVPTQTLMAGIGSGDEIAAQRVQLTWQAPTTGGTTTGYNVYRSVNGGAALQLNGVLVTAASYSDEALVEGELCYTVKAVGASALEGPPSGTACVTLGPPPPPPPAAPTGLVATLQGTTPESVLLQWTPPSTGSPAAGYNVYRSVGGGALQKINAALVTETSYIDPNLLSEAHCYEVTGVDALDREGTHSSTQCVDFTLPPPPPPGAPLSLTAQLVSTPGGAVTGVAAYAFDEGSGQSVEDATGNGHTGQLGSTSGVDTADPVWGIGLDGNALVFDGLNDRALVPDAADLHLAGSFTIEAWIQRGATGSAHCILSKGDSQRRNFWLLLTSSGYIDFRWETASGVNHGTTSSVTVTDNAWHHVAGVYDMESGQDRIYLDGVLVKSSGDSGTPATSTDPLYIGTRLSSGSLKDYFRGSIDLARVSAGAIYAAGFTPAQSFGGGPPRMQADLAWQPPASGTPVGYNVYRQVDGGGFVQINTELVAATTWADVSPPSGGLCYQVTAVDVVAQEGPTSEPACIGPVTTKTRAMQEQQLPIQPRILASPNPFNPATTIAYRLPSTSYVLLTVYDVRGTRVATLVSGERPAGDHTVRWEGQSDSGNPVASGAYFALLRAGSVQLKEKLILLK